MKSDDVCWKYVWRKGPPPHIGWWNASAYKDAKVWRYWNGKTWSSPIFDYKWSKKLMFQLSDYLISEVRWRYYYGTNTIKNRVDPETGIVTGYKGKI